MSNRFGSPFPQFIDATGLPYAGANLFAYASGTSTKLATYSDSALTVPNTNPIVLNSAGQPSVAVFLQNADYKFVLAPSTDSDPPASPIWTADPVRASDFASFAVTKVCSGNPTGQLAGTAGSAGVLPTVAWDYLNSVLYFCTTTGSASTAVWTSVNASATTAPILQPQGRLTLTSGTPVISVEVASATSVFYTPAVGNLCPVYNGSAFVNTTFPELTLSLVASHALNTIYDVFVFLNSGVITVGTGPAWSTITAGAGARGSGAGTTQLARLNGLLTNAQQITVRNGSTTYTVAGNYGTYVGSLFIDGTAGQITCNNTYGQSRKWGVWNAFNRQRIVMQMGDATASWTYSTATIRQSNAAAGNTIAAFCGLAEEPIEIEFAQIVVSAAAAGWAAILGIGVDSTTVISGRRGKHVDGGLGTPYVTPPLVATHVLSSLLGVSNLNALEMGNGTAGSTYQGANADMLFTARWQG